MRIKFSAALLFICSFFFGCRRDIPAEMQRETVVLAGPEYSGRLKIVTWNVQTFFDAQKKGSEYPEFITASSPWNRSAYITRLKRLCNVLRSLDADVFVMQELENSSELYDISNMLAEITWYPGKVYRYGCFAAAENSALGCAVLSRYPLCDMKVHSLDVRSRTIPPPLRPLLEVTVLAGNSRLVLLVNHWKSRIGGKIETEVWRNWEESQLCEIILLHSDNQEMERIAVLACGDFNRDISEFFRVKTIVGTCLLFRCAWPGVSVPSRFQKSSAGYIDMAVYSPWNDSGESYDGSYCFNGKWERIDHFFTAGTASILSFKVENSGVWVDENGLPKKYRLWTGSGYSDHLPLSCVVLF
jgi:endonuclease/exonuclease/phosphatase family metal-dependent hydrolase